MRVKDAVGRFGEQTAARRLEAAGLTIVEHNWRAPRVAGSDGRGEIDLVAREGDALVVVEVKTRSGTGFGSPAEAVTADKRPARPAAGGRLAGGSSRRRSRVRAVRRRQRRASRRRRHRRAPAWGVLMSLARASCVALVGIEGHLVEVEVHLAQGLPGVTLIGLPDTSLYEARDRVKSAVVNSDQVWPDKRITVGVACLPARFTLVLAANPCPCGTSGTPRGDAACTCPPRMRLSYRNRLSGSLLDRVDVRIRLEPPSRLHLRAAVAKSESTQVVAARVIEARAAAAKRLAGTPWRAIADVPGPQLRARWGLRPALTAEADRQFERGQLTARGLDRMLRTAWTLADLAGVTSPGRCHVEQALALRLSGGAW
jgi:Holliday junction resolvase-like predicted endonuclease